MGDVEKKKKKKKPDGPNLCPVCNGEGRTSRGLCKTCKGSGIFIPKSKSFKT